VSPRDGVGLERSNIKYMDEINGVESMKVAHSQTPRATTVLGQWLVKTLCLFY
jgi:hypothetical protein